MEFLRELWIWAWAWTSWGVQAGWEWLWAQPAFTQALGSLALAGFVLLLLNKAARS